MPIVQPPYVRINSRLYIQDWDGTWYFVSIQGITHVGPVLSEWLEEMEQYCFIKKLDAMARATKRYNLED